MKKLLFTLTAAAILTGLLFTACSEVDTTIAGEPPPAERIDKTALEEAIAEAENLVKNTRINTNADDVPGNIYWVPQNIMSAFTSAISKAKSGALSAADQSAVITAKTDLDNAIENFRNTRQKGTGVKIDMSALSVKITRAKKTKLGVEEIKVTKKIEDGIEIEIFEGIENVALEAGWIKKDAMDAFDKAINDAQKIYETAKSQNEIDEAVTALETAIGVFTAEIKTGAKENGFTQGELDAKISAAETVKTGILVRANDENGDGISPSLLWVTQEDSDALNKAIAAAEGAVDANRDKLLLDLVKAVNNFTKALETGTIPDRDRLYTLIAAAESLKGTSAGFDAVYEAAEDVFYDSDATKIETDAAITALIAALGI